MSFYKTCLLLAIVHQVVSQTIQSTPTTPSNSTVPPCPDGLPEISDFGDLNAPGSGRVLELKNGQFEVKGEKVFLSGMNVPYIKSGKDFGDGYYASRKSEYECYLRHIHSAGGNSMRVYLHDRGQATPRFSKGQVIGLDINGTTTFIGDVKTLLRAAAKNDIVVFLTLWEGRHQSHAKDLLINGESALQSYLDNALIPLVRAVKDEPGLGGFDIMSQTEKLALKKEVSLDPCFDTTVYHTSHNAHYSMQNLLRFVSRQADAIHRVDPNIPVTTEAFTDETIHHGQAFNHLKDSCLLKAGGDRFKLGHLDFYSLCSLNGNLHEFKLNATGFTLDKPLVLSSFSSKEGDGKTSPEQFQWAYHHGYSGAWSWHASAHHADKVDSIESQEHGLEAIESENDNLQGGLVNFTLS